MRGRIISQGRKHQICLVQGHIDSDAIVDYIDVDDMDHHTFECAKDDKLNLCMNSTSRRPKRMGAGVRDSLSPGD